MRKLARSVVAFLAVAAAISIASVALLREPGPEDPKARVPLPSPSAARAPRPLVLAPTPSPSPESELSGRLARARILAADLDPSGVPFLEQLVADATSGGEPRFAEAAAGELARLRDALHAEAARQAAWLTDEAHELAHQSSNAAIGRMAEAILATRAAGDPDHAALLERELETLRQDLRRHEAEDAFERARAANAPDTGADEDEEVRHGLAALQAGDAAAFEPLGKLLLDRATSSHRARACARALRHVDLARRALELYRQLGRDEGPARRLESALDQRELACRREEGGRAIQRGDGLGALDRLDLGALCKLDGASSFNPRVLYLYGRALESDGRIEQALASYHAAIGTVSWLPPDAPLELVRWLARRRAQRKGITITSPGVGPTWRRLPRAHYTLFCENEGSVASLEKTIETARALAVERLGVGDPVRLQAKTVLFVFANEERYHDSDVAPKGWAIGHASSDGLEDGRGNSIVVFDPGSGTDVSLENVLTHEWTHVLVDQHLKGATLPSWAAEGVASFTESEPWRSRRLERWARICVMDDNDQRNLKFWRQFLGIWYDSRYAGENAAEAERFYSEALLAFDVIARHSSARVALDLAMHIDDAIPPPREAAPASSPGAGINEAPPTPDILTVLGFEKPEDFLVAAKALFPDKKTKKSPAK